MSKLETALNDKIIKQIPLSGGCIASAEKIYTSNGRKFFHKKYAGVGIATAEAHGLEELRKSTEICIPNIVFYDDKSLVLEYIEQSAHDKNFFEKFGRALAKLHMTSSNSFGFYEDNYIGSSKQKNSQKESWSIFFSHNRIGYQCTLANKNEYLSKTQIDNIVTYIENELSQIDILPSLLHGDLWSGNYIVDKDSQPVLIDPAVYYGHWESELAMTKLFGGFASDFYDAYYEINPKTEGYAQREDFYTLYHLLNHLNLFGRSYYGQVMAIINRYI